MLTPHTEHKSARCCAIMAAGSDRPRLSGVAIVVPRSARRWLASRPSGQVPLICQPNTRNEATRCSSTAVCDGTRELPAKRTGKWPKAKATSVSHALVEAALLCTAATLGTGWVRRLQGLMF